MIFKENFRLNFQIMKKNNLKKSLKSNYLTNKKEINFKETFLIFFLLTIRINFKENSRFDFLLGKKKEWILKRIFKSNFF